MEELSNAGVTEGISNQYSTQYVPGFQHFGIN